MKATPEDVAKHGVLTERGPHGRRASMKATPEDVAKLDAKRTKAET